MLAFPGSGAILPTQICTLGVIFCQGENLKNRDGAAEWLRKSRNPQPPRPNRGRPHRRLLHTAADASDEIVDRGPRNALRIGVKLFTDETRVVCPIQSL